MSTAAQFRKMVLALADVEESSHMDHPDFRRSGKIFAGLTRDEKTGTLRLSPEIQSTVAYEGSEFTPAAGAWGEKGWTQVDLARVDVAVLKELVREAWTLLGESLKGSKKKKAPAKKKAPKKKAAAKAKTPAKARARR